MQFEDDSARPLPPKVPIIRPEAYPMPRVGIVTGSRVTPAAARPNLAHYQPGFRGDGKALYTAPPAPVQQQTPGTQQANVQHTQQPNRRGPTVAPPRGPTTGAPPHAIVSPAARTVRGRPVASVRRVQ